MIGSLEVERATAEAVGKPGLLAMAREKYPNYDLDLVAWDPQWGGEKGVTECWVYGQKGNVVVLVKGQSMIQRPCDTMRRSRVVGE